MDACSDLDLEEVCDGNLHKVITSHAQALGVPPDFILLPLLTCSSALLAKSTVKISEMWKERCQLWTACLAHRHSRKSAVLNAFGEAVNILEADIVVYTDPPGEVRGEALMHLGLFEDLLPSDNSEDLISKKLKDVYEGAWTSLHTVYSMFGFIHPSKSLLSRMDPHILLTRPTPVSYRYSDYKPIPSNTPSLTKVFDTLHQAHSAPRTYTLNSSALEEFEKAFDSFHELQHSLDESDLRRAVYSLACGHLLRLAACLLALRQAVKVIVYHEDIGKSAWNTTLSCEDIINAKRVLDTCIQHKLHILGQTQDLQATPDCMTPQPICSSNLTSTVPPTFVAPPSITSLRPPPPKKPRPILPKDTVTPQPPAPLPPTPQLPLQGYPQGVTLIMQAPQGVAPPTAQNWDCTPPAVDNSQSALSGPHRAASSLTERIKCSDLHQYSEEERSFVAAHAYKIKKCLEYHLDMRITPSVCAQRHLMPPISRSEMALYSTQTRYPVAVAKEFLSTLAHLGFYVIEETVHPTNNRRNMTFLKIPYDDLSGKAQQLLTTLGMTAVEYMAPYSLYQTPNHTGRRGQKTTKKTRNNSESTATPESPLEQPTHQDMTDNLHFHPSPIKIEPMDSNTSSC